MFKNILLHKGLSMNRKYVPKGSTNITYQNTEFENKRDFINRITYNKTLIDAPSSMVMLQI